MFKRSRHNNLSNFTNSQDYYELSTKMIRDNGNVYHLFKPNNFLEARNIYQDKVSMDLTKGEFKHLTSICWNKKFQPLTIDMRKDCFQCRYRLGLNSKFIPNTFPF